MTNPIDLDALYQQFAGAKSDAELALIAARNFRALFAELRAARVVVEASRPIRRELLPYMGDEGGTMIADLDAALAAYEEATK